MNLAEWHQWHYRNYKLAPDDSSQWKCNWLDCGGGVGLAGHGWCSFAGDWSDPNCPEFLREEQFEMYEYFRWVIPFNKLWMEFLKKRSKQCPAIQ